MCGIYGMVSLSGTPLRHAKLLDRMGDSLLHRGPDGRNSIRLAHAAIGADRLRIRDRRPEGDQPFHDRERAHWLVANGEIYNARDLRHRFASYCFRSRSDIEPLVPLMSADGAGGLCSVDGMFALAFWSERDRMLMLARDRAGEKPLFYTETEGEIWFASEIQALLLHPAVARDLDRAAVSDYLALGYVREPHTLFRQIYKVPAATCLTFKVGSCAATATSIPYSPATTQVSDDEARRQATRLLTDAVLKQVEADVPVGVLTSGGMDSSLIAAIASDAVGPHNLRTFTARFSAPSYDEGGFARRVSRHLGMSTVEVWVDEGALGRALKMVTEHLAEPIADPAVLPTLLIALTAKESVGVVLSGEGADELFGGYPTYAGHRLAANLRHFPKLLTKPIEALTTRPAASHRAVTPWFLIHSLLRYRTDDWVTRHLTWFGTALFPYLDQRTRDRIRGSLPRGLEDMDPVAGAMQLDFCTYLREGLLAKIDRATMLASLEARAPYLDAGLVSFARALPPRLKVDQFTTKGLLKDVARGYLPRGIVRRRKRGLSVPIAGWLNDGLRAEVDRLLDPARLRRQGVLPALPINQLLQAHRTGQANNARALWALVMFQYWLERWVPGKA